MAHLSIKNRIGTIEDRDRLTIALSIGTGKPVAAVNELPAKTGEEPGKVS